jgi:hypothetical protein
MSRVSQKAVVSAVKSVSAMDLRQKEALADELFLAQPNMFGSVLVLQRMGVSPEKMDFALNLLLICFQAMKETGLAWPLITEAEQDKQMARYVAAVRFGEDLPPAQSQRAMMQYLNAHPEKQLLAYVTTELTKWLGSVAPDESDTYVMLGCANLVNCIAFVPMPATGKKT